MVYKPPKTIPEVMQAIEFDKALDLNDPRFVETREARGSERTRKLLYQLALLACNDGSWRSSHPVVRTLEGYMRAAAQPDPQPNG
jgi:hypothetical protein